MRNVVFDSEELVDLGKIDTTFLLKINKSQPNFEKKMAQLQLIAMK